MFPNRQAEPRTSASQIPSVVRSHSYDHSLPSTPTAGRQIAAFSPWKTRYRKTDGTVGGTYTVPLTIQKLTSAKRFSSVLGPRLTAAQREVHLDRGLHFHCFAIQDIWLVAPLTDRIDCRLV